MNHKIPTHILREMAEEEKHRESYYATMMRMYKEMNDADVKYLSGKNKISPMTDKERQASIEREKKNGN